MNSYTEIWCASARKCRPTEEWHWDILARDYQTEFQWVRLAFMGWIVGKEPKSERGATWQEIEIGARKIAEAIAEKFTQRSRSLPYVNTLWLVGCGRTGTE